MFSSVIKDTVWLGSVEIEPSAEPMIHGVFRRCC